MFKLYQTCRLGCCSNTACVLVGTKFPYLLPTVVDKNTYIKPRVNSEFKGFNYQILKLQLVLRIWDRSCHWTDKHTYSTTSKVTAKCLKLISCYQGSQANKFPILYQCHQGFGRVFPQNIYNMLLLLSSYVKLSFHIVKCLGQSLYQDLPLC